MKLIEKKCPNCGGSLEFSETDKSCKCEYCHRAFEIERDANLDVGDIAEQFNLSELEGPLKAFGIMHIVVTIFIFLVAIGMFVGIAYSIFKAQKESPALIEEFIEENTEKETNQLLSDVSLLNDAQLEDIENEAKSIAYQTAKGQNDTKYSYQTSDSLRLEKIYIASKDDTNQLVVVFKSSWHNFFNQSDNQTVYTPVVFKNVHENLDFHNGKNPAPEYYFNPEKTSYIYAYKSLEETYEKVLKPLENEGYKITQN